MNIVPPTAENIFKAAELIMQGQLVIIPTETVYGVAARADMPAAMEKLYAAKGRAGSKRIAFLVADIDAARTSGVYVGDKAMRIATRYWPGPLTMVLQHANGDWDGFRVPANPVATAWLCALDSGVLAAVTSANQSGFAPTLTAQDAWLALEPNVALALDGGPSAGGRPSTVVKVYPDDSIELLREGPIPFAALESV